MARTWCNLAALIGLISLTVLGCKPQPPDADDDDTWGDDDDTWGDDDDTFQPPELAIAITSPPEGTIGTQASVRVEGTVTGSHPVVIVNGNEAQVEGDTFSVEIALHNQDPFTPILAEAVDETGWVRDRHTYLHGDKISASDRVRRGLAVRLTDRGMDGLEAFVLASFTPDSIAQMILASNPLYDDSWLGNQVVVTADDATIGGLELDLDAMSDGIHIDAALTDVAIDVTADAGWVGTYEGTVYVDEVLVTGIASLSASGGSLVVDIPELTVELVNMTTDFPGIWDWIEDLILWLIPGFLEDAVSSMLQEEVVAAVEQVLGSLDQGFPLGPVTVGLAFDTVQHDNKGIAAILDLELALGPGGGDTPDERVSTPGDLPQLTGSTTPMENPYGAWVVLDDDALNAIGIALFGSGLLNQQLEGTLPGDIPMELNAGLLMGMFPSLEGELEDGDPLTITTSPSVPLVGRPRPGPEGVLEFILPGFLVDIAGDLDGDGTADPIFTLAIDGVLLVGIDPDGDSLSVSGEDMAATLIRSSIDSEKSEGEDLATLLQLAIGLMVGDLVDQLVTLIDGMAMVALEGGACGPEEDHASFYADLLPAAP